MSYKPIEVLVADDEASITFCVREWLEGSETRYQVDTARNGLEFLEKLRRGDYDIAVTDIRMPVMDGIEAIIRARNEGIDIPIVVATATPSDYSRIEGYSNVFLVHNPFDLPQLEATVLRLYDQASEKAA